MKRKDLTLFLGTLAAGAVIFQILKGTWFHPPNSFEHSPAIQDAVPKETKFDESLKKPDLDPLAGQLPRQPDKPALKKEAHGFPTENKAAPMQEQALTRAEEEEIYLRAQVFRDEALEVFPVYSVEIHRPKSLDTGWVEENGIMVEKSYGPAPDEIWIRIRPENAQQMREIMAQMADLYQTYAGVYGRSIRIINWVGGQAWAAFTYPPTTKWQIKK